MFGGIAKGRPAGPRPCQLLAVPCHFDFKNPQSLNLHNKWTYLFSFAPGNL